MLLYDRRRPEMRAARAGGSANVAGHYFGKAGGGGPPGVPSNGTGGGTTPGMVGGGSGKPGEPTGPTTEPCCNRTPPYGSTSLAYILPGLKKSSVFTMGWVLQPASSSVN